MDYPPIDIRFKYYGKHVEQLVGEAVACTDAVKQESLVIHIARLMKFFYLEWNRESVSDETLAKHMADLSDGKLKLDLEKARQHNLLEQTRRGERSRPKTGGGSNNQSASRFNNNNRRNKRKKS